MGKVKEILYVIISLAVAKKKLILELSIVASALAIIWVVGIVPIYLFNKDQFKEEEKPQGEVEPEIVSPNFMDFSKKNFKVE